jgi:glycosyltransferase involved in cell wall biosynthesis
MKQLSVIIPMFNEEEIIQDTISSVVVELGSLKIDWELVLVNDGSTDATAEICRAAVKGDPRIRLVDYGPNRGRGYALRRGFLATNGEYVISIDADLTYSPDHISLIWRELNQSGMDIVLGSAYMPGGRTVNVPFKRLLISRIGNLILGLAFPGHLKTITCVLRGYRREVLDSLELEADGKEIHLEILAKAISVGFKIKEIPAVLTARQKGKSKFRFKSTSISHLLFSFYQKPMVIFGLLGFLMVLVGIILGVMFVVQRYMGTLNPTRPIFILMILLLLAGVQMLSFGFISNQIGIIRKEIYKIQKGNKGIEKHLRNI